MALTVGNLLTDAAAQSFISLADAEAYLAPEMPTAWGSMTAGEKEAALVRASRWLAATYRFRALTDDDVTRVGLVAARIAAEAGNEPLFKGTETASVVESEKVGPLAVSYKTGLRADAAGVAWPWLRPMLFGLTLSSSTVPVQRA